MNIVEAVTLANDGLFVRRASWDPEVYLGLDDWGLYIAILVSGVHVQQHFSITIEEILGIDWEIYYTGSQLIRVGLTLRKSK